MQMRTAPKRLKVNLLSYNHHFLAEEFFNQRFVGFAGSYHSAIINGSSLAYLNLTKEEGILDASCGQFIQDKDHVIIGFSQTTADGLGGSLIDENENDSIA